VFFATAGIALFLTACGGGSSGGGDVTTVDAAADRPLNVAPEISGAAATQIAEDSVYRFTPGATDVDGDSLTFSITNRPAWASFDSSTGELTGIPRNAHVGNYSNIVISVSDGLASASLPAFTIRVSNTNDAPVISGTPATRVNADSYYNFRPSADDVDNGDTLRFSIQNRPSWASFNTTSGQLSGIPDNGAVGVYSGIAISVSDGTVSRSLSAFSITVSGSVAGNTAPVISGSPATSVAAGSAYDFRPQASDANNDTLQFSISGRPSWANFNTGTGRLSGTPAAGDARTYTGIVISVSDGSAVRSLPAFNITVSDNTPQTGSISLNWRAPTRRANGDSLAINEIDGYRLYYGTRSGQYQYSINVTNGQTTSYVVNDLPLDTYYVVVTAYDVAGLESSYSNEAVKPAQ